MRTRTRVVTNSCGKDSYFEDSGIRIDAEGVPFSHEEPVTRFNTDDKICRLYHVILDTTQSWLKETYFGYSAHYKGKHPKLRPFSIKKKVAQGRMYNMHPVIHLKKEYGHSGPIGLKFTGPLRTGDYYGGFPGIHFYWRAEPTIHFYDPDFLRVYLPPISQDLHSEFLDSTDCGEAFLHDYRKRAMQEILPDMEAGFSLPVFLAEFRDVPGMIRGLVRGLTKFGNFLTQLLNRPLKEISHMQLAGSFGWIPFIGDTKKLINRLLYLRQDVVKFIEESNQRRTYHYSRELDPTDVKPADWFLESVYPITINCDVLTPSSPYYPLKRWFKTISFEVRCKNIVETFSYHATCEFSYSLPDNGRWTALLVALDRLGINLSPTDVWELIPFSFVIDWFINVQSALKQFDDTNCPAQVQISAFCDSLQFDLIRSFDVVNVSYVVQDEGHIAPAYDDLWTITPVYPDSLYYSEKGYYRFVGCPPTNQDDFPNLTLPHGMQIVNLIALGGART